MEIPSKVLGQNPGRGSGGSPLEAEAVCRHCLQILAAETIIRTFHLLILDQYVSRWG